MILELRQNLARSNSEMRKAWAQRVIDDGIALQDLLPLIHGDEKTAQRFTWFVGDLCELEPGTVRPVLPLLFSLRDEMPFPGMHRSLAKWLGLTNVPPEIEDEAMEWLAACLTNNDACIASKSFSAKVLFDLVEQSRFSSGALAELLCRQAKGSGGNSSEAFERRMQALLNRLKS